MGGGEARRPLGSAIARTLPSVASSLAVLAFTAAGTLLPAMAATASGAPLPVPRTQEVRDAEVDLAQRQEALASERAGLEAAITLEPSVELLARDDPPRPAAWTPGAELGAELTWAPLRNQVLLAEARVLEARAALANARREAGYRALRAPVEAARARRTLRHARADRAAAREALGQTRREAASAAPDQLPPLRRAQREAELALREAELEVAERRRQLADWERELVALGATLDADAPELRRVALPPPADAAVVARSYAYRARVLRTEAAIALDRRRATASVLDDLALEAGYYGADGRLEAGVELASGRPRASASVRSRATTRERWEVTLSASLRVGSDGPAAWRSLARTRADAERTRARLRADLLRSRREARAEVEERAARLALAEDHWRVVAEHTPGDEEALDDALDGLQREWLRWLRSVDRLLRVSEGAWRMP